MRCAFNTNHRAYAGAISALDGHFSVLRAVINDIHRKDVTVDAEGNIDWDTYYGWYNAYLKNQEQGDDSSTSEKIPEEQVFGGNYGSGD